MSNANLHKSKKAKNDEFYTRYIDIEKEMKNYESFFAGKTVYSNCDNDTSNFVKYFQKNKERLGIKKFIYSGFKDGKGISFDSDDAIEMLKEADVVVTNPPFSLFRKYIELLVKYNKKFCVVGNLNATVCESIFPLIQQDKIWLSGYNNFKNFVSPNGSIVRICNACWYTNLDTPHRHRKAVLRWKYNPSRYRKYDNFDAIEVSDLKSIPKDYTGMMGVPYTFLRIYNPEQFSIIGSTHKFSNCNSKIYGTQTFVGRDGKRYNSLKLNGCPSMEIDAPPKDKNYYVFDGKYYISLYGRILIKRKD